MKTYLFAFLFICTSIPVLAQNKQTITEKIKVWGNCGMCKETIETAAKSAGAATATWNEDTDTLTVTYLSSTTNNLKIQQRIAAAGYDTEKLTASQKAYDNLHGCCKYERKAVIKQTACCKPADQCTKACCKKMDKVTCCTSTLETDKCCKEGKSCCK
jgi:periplasmic mercuric ion binding protein